MPGPPPIRIVCYHPPLSAHPAFVVLLEILRARAETGYRLIRRDSLRDLPA
jgi:hypothetical protein